MIAKIAVKRGSQAIDTLIQVEKNYIDSWLGNKHISVVYHIQYTVYKVQTHMNGLLLFLKYLYLNQTWLLSSIDVVLEKLVCKIIFYS